MADETAYVALADLTDEEAAAVDFFMNEHMHGHAISNSYPSFACNTACRTDTLAEAFRREVLVPRRRAMSASPERSTMADESARAACGCTIGELHSYECGLVGHVDPPRDQRDETDAPLYEWDIEVRQLDRSGELVTSRTPAKVLASTKAEVTTKVRAMFGATYDDFRKFWSHTWALNSVQEVQRVSSPGEGLSGSDV